MPTPNVCWKMAIILHIWWRRYGSNMLPRPADGGLAWFPVNTGWSWEFVPFPRSDMTQFGLVWPSHIQSSTTCFHLTSLDIVYYMLSSESGHIDAQTGHKIDILRLNHEFYLISYHDSYEGGRIWRWEYWVLFLYGHCLVSLLGTIPIVFRLMEQQLHCCQILYFISVTFTSGSA